jgi:hypothetical protein
VVGLWQDDTQYLYVDGELQSTHDTTGTLTYDNQADFRIGHSDNCCDWLDPRYYFNGSIDEVAVYNRVFSEEEILALYNWQGGGDISWLSTDPISGTVLSNSSVPIQVTFDATGMELGEHTAEIAVLSNDPVTPWVSVPVTMTVVERQADLSLTPPTQEGTGVPGDTVIYSFSLMNEGNYTDTFSLDASGAWLPTLSAISTGQLGMGKSFVFTLEVAIPSNATEGSSDTTTVTAQSGFDSAVSGSAEVITTAGPPLGWRVYLPIVLKVAE